MMKLIFPNKLLLTDTQLSKIQSGRYIFSSPSDIIFNKRIIPLIGSIVKEPTNVGANIMNIDIFADAGLNLIFKKIKQRNFINCKFMNNSNKLKDIIKVIKSLENRGILSKGTTRKVTSQEEGF